MLSEWFGLIVTPEQFDEIISRQAAMWTDIVNDPYPGDTMVREMLIDMVVKDFGLDYWPLNGSPREYSTSFFEQYAKIAASRGYKAMTD